MKIKAIIESGYFNSIHKGHLEYFINAKALAYDLFVIVSNIKAVYQAILKVDEDRTVCATLEKTANDYGDNYELAVANGGDQNNDIMTERLICEKMDLALI